MKAKNKNLYELSFWLKDLSQEKVSSILESFQAKLLALGAEINKFSPGRRRRPAETISNNRLALFGYAYFSLAPEKISELEDFLKSSEELLRFAIFRHKTFEVKEPALPARRPSGLKPETVSAQSSVVNPEELEKKLAEILGEEK